MIRLALVALLATPTLAQQPQQGPTAQPPAQEGENLPEAAELFARHVEAIGGEDALRAHKNRVSRGSFRGYDESFALLTSWAEAPDKLRIRYEPPGQPIVETIYNDGYAWRVIDVRRAMLISNEELRQLRDDADFFADLEPTRRYEQMKTVRRIEKTESAGAAYEVWARFPYGKTELHYFDADTGLRLATRSSSSTEEGQQPISIAYRDYRPVSGVQVPHQITIVRNPGDPGEQTSTVIFNEIKANVQSVPSWDMPPPLAEQVKKIEATQGGSGG